MNMTSIELDDAGALWKERHAVHLYNNYYHTWYMFPCPKCQKWCGAKGRGSWGGKVETPVVDRKSVV